MEITIKLNTTSQTANFIKQMPSFMAYGGMSVVRAKLNTFSHAAGG
jgi:hypothetical protein